MLITRLLQVLGINSCILHHRCNIAVDLTEFFLRYLNINTAQIINGVCHRSPVYRNIIIHCNVQVFIQRLDGLFRASSGICFIDLPVGVLFAYLKISIPVNAGHLDLTSFPVQAAYNNHIRIGTLSQVAVCGIHTEDSHFPEAFLYLFRLLIQIWIGHLFHLDAYILGPAQQVVHVIHSTACCCRKNKDHCQQDRLPGYPAPTSGRAFSPALHLPGSPAVLINTHERILRPFLSSFPYKLYLAFSEVSASLRGMRMVRNGFCLAFAQH